MRANYLIHSASFAILSITIASAAAPPVPAGSTVPEGESPTTRSLYLVQAPSLSAAQQSVRLIDAKVDRKFQIIHAVSAYLTAGQADRLSLWAHGPQACDDDG